MIIKRQIPVFIVCGVVALVVASIPGAIWCEDGASSPVGGQVYHEDKTTSVEGASVQFQNILDGDVYKALITGKDGVFEIEGVLPGLYSIVVRMDKGEYRSQIPVGIRGQEGGKVASLSIVLKDEGEQSEGDVGIASVVSGNDLIVCGFVDIDDNPREAGPFRPSRAKSKRK